MNDLKPQTGHEETDVQPGMLALIIVTLFVSCALIMLVTGGLLDVIERGTGLPATTAPSSFPAPRLQVSPRADLLVLREQARQRLSSSGQLEDGRVHIPIERAMEILAERGLRPTGRRITRLDLMQERPKESNAR